MPIKINDVPGPIFSIDLRDNTKGAIHNPHAVIIDRLDDFVPDCKLTIDFTVEQVLHHSIDGFGTERTKVRRRDDLNIIDRV